MAPSENSSTCEGCIPNKAFSTSKAPAVNNAGGCSAPGHVSAGKNSSTLETNGQAVTVRLYTYLTNWDLLIMFLTIAPMAGFTITQPYQQTRRSELDCGPVCYGSMTSLSSFLGLIGAPLVGALSDQKGRKFALFLGCLSGALSFVILGLSSSLFGLWLALIPSALLSHNFTVTKAVVADLAGPQERAGILGKLGLAAGLGFMVGPLVHPFIDSYTQAVIFATSLQIMSLFAVWLLPSRKCETVESTAETPGRSVFFKACSTVWEAIKEVFHLAVAAPASAKVILFLRFGLSIGFHVFFTVMSVILKDKFKFGPNDYSNYFAFVGLFYALSQLLSKRIINNCSDDPTWMVVACVFFLMLGRLVTALTSSIYVMYLGVTLSIVALGVLNNAINTTVTRISEAGSVGGLMGVLDTAEKLAGVVGPTAGGVLYASHPMAPVAAVTAGYVLMMALVAAAFPRFLVPALRAAAAAAAASRSKQE